jgi:hypothetical protein
MPRRLPEHTQFLKHLITPYLPKDWSIYSIDGLTEAETAEVLSRSSIFLSFSDREGLPLPPMEAALAGNIVIGYTGQGSKEYFEPPIFYKIDNGDFINFRKQVLSVVERIDRDNLDPSEMDLKESEMRQQYGYDASLRYLASLKSKFDHIQA